MRKYETSFRRIIEVKGKEKQLKSVIADYVDIDKLTDEEIQNKNIVVAFGNDKIIYRFPSLAEYLKNYFSNNNDFTPSIAVKFIENQPLATPIPIKKYLRNIKAQIHNSTFEKEKVKLTKRLNQYGDFTYDKYIDSLQNPKSGGNRIYVSRQNNNILSKIKTPQDIIKLTSIKETPKINFLTKNLNNFDRKQIDELMTQLLKQDEKVITASEYRKLFMAYSLI